MSNFSGPCPELQLSGESKQVIRDILQSNDTDNKGYLTVDELAISLQNLGFTPDDEDVDFLVKHMDDDGDGTLEVDEVLGNIDVINYHCFYGKELMEEFKRIDKDGDGVIRFPEMLKVLTTRGEKPLEPTEGRRLLDKLARKFDANFDGKFNYTEFVKIYMSDMLPYKDELESGQFKVGDYTYLDNGEKKKKKKPRSTVASGQARDDNSSKPPAPHRTVSSVSSTASLPGYMRPKTERGAPRQLRSSTSLDSSNLPGYMRPKTGGQQQHQHQQQPQQPPPSQDNLPGYMRPITRQPANNDHLPGYMRPRTGAIRNAGGSRADTITSSSSSNSKPKTGASKSRQSDQEVTKKSSSSSRNYFGYTPTS